MLVQAGGAGRQSWSWGLRISRTLDLERLSRSAIDLAGAGDFSDDMFRYARQFGDCRRTVVMAAPYWDLLFPAMVEDLRGGDNR